MYYLIIHTVRFTQSFYGVIENQSAVVVCAEVKEDDGECLFDFGFKVGFMTTASGSASKWSYS